MRFASDPVWVRRETGDREGPNLVWMRADGALPDDQVLPRCRAGLASDTTIQDPIIARQGLSWGYDRVGAATLNQSIWFHGRARFNEFHLFRNGIAGGTPTAAGSPPGTSSATAS